MAWNAGHPRAISRTSIVEQGVTHHAMTDNPPLAESRRDNVDPYDSRLRLHTSVRLRWFAVIGQTIAVAIVAGLFGFPLPVGYCLAFIALSAWLNVFLRILYTARHRLSAPLAAALLVYDVLQLAVLIYLTGGIENPFIVLLVAPVTVSAATLPPRWTILIGALAVACTALLASYHLPLPWLDTAPLAGPLAFPMLYKLGILAAIVSCLVFIALYAWRLSKEARLMSAALTATEFVLAHEQKLHALDGLAAAAAHELGTPLATIVLVTKELERELDPGSPHAEDIALLRTQAQRCREILQKLTQSPEEQDPLHASLSLGQLIEEATDPHSASHIRIVVDAAPTARNGDGETDTPEPIAERRPGMIYGIGNIVENAVDFARSTVTITARWSAREVAIVVTDDGPGIAPDILDTIGEPYVTTRSGARQARQPGQRNGGLGLGLFIAKTLLERSGATLAFANRTDGPSGASVRIVWPRTAFEGKQPGWPGTAIAEPRLAAH
jgi:two-component system sensor histidine kinase RegB